MEIDPTEPDSTIIQQKSEALQSLATGSLSTSIARLSGSSRGIPSDKDFHFYYLFDEFRAPIDEIAAAAQAMLEKIGSSEQFWGSGSANAFPGEDIDDDAAYNWLVSVNDEVLERVDVSVDEFLRMRKEQEEGGAKKPAVDDDGFQLVCGKKKKTSKESVGGEAESTPVRVVEKDKKVATAKPKVPFHIATIRRPQDEYNILVNNANQPFEHVWLQKSEDGSRFIHPLEALSANDFVDRKIGEPLKPAPLANTPFKMVETVKDLKEMAAKLRIVDEIAVDLEHNQYRSFQGLTCLMQISTRTEDFVVDTLKLRVHIGPYLREIFKDPSKKKVLHGADRDVIWLQRDFGIYICNLFDTGQASRVLKLERNSLEYLLHHFCDVTANKEYQNADWRLRPLPQEMIRYAREDTHYLLYIYDLMRAKLLSESAVDENSEDLLLEVYQRSRDICMQLYEKELLTDTSYLHIYGLQIANFNAQQLAVASGLYEWRDAVAREQDESTGYILPNKTLMEIAKQMPVTTNKLKHVVRYKHPYIERNLSSVVSIIRHSTQHSASFEAVVKQLAEARVARLGSEAPEPDSLAGEEPHGMPDSSMVENVTDNTNPGIEIGASGAGDSSPSVSPKTSHNNVSNGSVDTPFARQSPAVDVNNCEKNTSRLEPQKATGATVQILKRPSRAFGAMFGNSTKKKVDPTKKERELTKLEQIKSSVSLPSHSFMGGVQASNNDAKMASEAVGNDPLAPNDAQVGPSEAMDACPSEENDEMHTESKMEDVIQLEGNSEDDDEPPIIPETDAAGEGAEEAKDKDDGSGPDDEDEPMSLSDLSSTLSKCLESSNQNQQKKETAATFQPFDYEAARKTIKFGEPTRGPKRVDANGAGSSKPGSKGKRGGGGGEAKPDQAGLLPQGRRRQAFPASGNRSATFL